MRENPVNFQPQVADWEYYRTSADMLRQGISLLNQYYYDWMGDKYGPGKFISDAELELMIKVIECLGGVFGFLPMVQPYIPDLMRHALLRALIQHKPRYKVYDEYAIPNEPYVTTKGRISYILSEHTLNSIVNDPAFPRILLPFEAKNLDKYEYTPVQARERPEYSRKMVLCQWLIGINHGSVPSIDTIPAISE